MEGEVAIFQKGFDSTIEQAAWVVNDILDLAVRNYPEISLQVSSDFQDKKQVWQGTFIEVRQWPQEPVIFGRIEIVELYPNFLNPVEVTIYCPVPDFITWNMQIEEFLLSHIPVWDGSNKVRKDVAQPIWETIPGNQQNRRILELWHKNLSSPVISDRLGLEPQTIYNILTALRKEYGEEIVPFHSRGRKKSRFR